MTTAKRTARITGLAYLGLAISGILGFLLVGEFHVPGDAARTAANLIANEGLARLALVADVATVLTQTATAVCFWKLFRPVHPVAAGSIAAFGLVNAVTILVGAALSKTALDVALRADTTSADQTLLLYDLHATVLTLAGLFFGLWLIPMGWLAVRSGHMPGPLGWILVGGGIGYLLSVLAAVILPDGSGFVDALTVPATIGELWMVGYLLAKGTADHTAASGQPTPDLTTALT